MQTLASTDPWISLRTYTSARIALGASGASLPTAEVLRLGLAHAQARDAVHQPWQIDALQQQLQVLQLPVLRVHSAAPDRHTYLLRPDWGRRLSAQSVAELQVRQVSPCDVLCVIGDGLSSTAVECYAAPLLQALLPLLQTQGLRIGPVVLAQQARVALGDPIAQALQAQLVLMLVGERPGLSSCDSMGAYVTWAPQIGTPDSARNCVSNIRNNGLPPPVAAAQLHWLIAQAFRQKNTGVRLKDESDAPRQFEQVREAESGASATGGRSWGLL